jgi:hypothetical protein
MPLSHEQVHKLEQWLDSQGVNRSCPMCGGGSGRWVKSSPVRAFRIKETCFLWCRWSVETVGT